MCMCEIYKLKSCHNDNNILIFAYFNNDIYRYKTYRKNEVKSSTARRANYQHSQEAGDASPELLHEEHRVHSCVGLIDLPAPLQAVRAPLLPTRPHHSVSQSVSQRGGAARMHACGGCTCVRARGGGSTVWPGT